MLIAVQCLKFSYKNAPNLLSAADVKVCLNSREVRLYPNELLKTDINNLNKQM